MWAPDHIKKVISILYEARVFDALRRKNAKDVKLGIDTASDNNIVDNFDFYFFRLSSFQLSWISLCLHRIQFINNVFNLTGAEDELSVYFLGRHEVKVAWCFHNQFRHLVLDYDGLAFGVFYCLSHKQVTLLLFGQYGGFSSSFCMYHEFISLFIEFLRMFKPPFMQLSPLFIVHVRI